MRALNELLQIMADLRDPQSGCPWDIAQDFDSIKPYTIEEAYEVVDAIQALDPDDPGKTVEGWPAPRRVVVVAYAP